MLSDDLERLAKDATPGPWQYEDDDEGSSMGSISYQIPAGGWTISRDIFEVCGDSAEQAFNSELAVILHNALPTIIAALRKDGQ